MSRTIRTAAIYLASLSGGERKRLVLAHSNPGYANGALIYLDRRRGLVIRQTLDVSSGQLEGEKQVDRRGRRIISLRPSTPLFPPQQTALWCTTPAPALPPRFWLGMTAAAKNSSRLGEPGVVANPSLSPDDAFVGADRTDIRAGNVDIWIHDVKRATASRFTFDPAEEVSSVWSRDGKKLAYRVVSVGTTVQIKDRNGTEPEKAIYSPPMNEAFDVIPNSWSRDGDQILCTTQNVKDSIFLGLVSTAGAGIKPFLKGTPHYTNGQFSPDGKWVAYASDESGDWEVYVTTYPGASGKWQVSRGGGNEPRWRGDGKEMFYLGPHEQLTAVEVNAGETFSAGVPVKLFTFQARAAISSTDLFTYDVAKDGKRFIVNRYVKPESIAPLTVVLNASAH